MFQYPVLHVLHVLCCIAGYGRAEASICRFFATITREKMLLIDLAGSEWALVTTNRRIRLKK